MSQSKPLVTTSPRSCVEPASLSPASRCVRGSFTGHRRYPCRGPADRTTSAMWNRLLDLYVQQSKLQETIQALGVMQGLVDTGEYEFIPEEPNDAI